MNRKAYRQKSLNIKLLPRFVMNWQILKEHIRNIYNNIKGTRNHIKSRETSRSASARQTMKKKVSQNQKKHKDKIASINGNKFAETEKNR